MMLRRRYRDILALGLWAGVFAAAATQTSAAETADRAVMGKTLVVITLDAQEQLSVRSTFESSPPTITMAFPKQKVSGSLPEHAAFQHGAIRAIRTEYGELGVDGKRTVRALHVVLRGPYAYEVRSEGGTITLEVRHPGTVGSDILEMGLRGEAVIGSIGQRQASERFRAMQEALAKALPETRHASPAQPVSPERNSQPIAAFHPDEQAQVVLSAEPRPSEQRWQAPALFLTRASTASEEARFFGWIMIAATALLVAAFAGGLWALNRWVGAHRSLLHQGQDEEIARSTLPSSLGLLDQLLWRAFEQQGYKLVSALELPKSEGILRTMVKEGSLSALLCLGNGTLIEKGAVERFTRFMAELSVPEGILAASGAFTIPAQRLASKGRVTLIGREQLVELLATGAHSEFMHAQLASAQSQIDALKHTVAEYTNELDMFRRQRNEASWHLGEERARSGRIEKEFSVLSQQLSEYETLTQRLEEDVSVLRKQWEESQWYLGESQARARHLQQQVDDLRAQRSGLEAQCASLQEQVDRAVADSRQLSGAIVALRQELQALRSYGERRGALRGAVPGMLVHVRGKEPGSLLRNISRTGMQVEVESELAAASPMRAQLSVPGSLDPVEVGAELVWRQLDGARWYHGYRFTELSDSAQTLIDQLLAQPLS